MAWSDAARQAALEARRRHGNFSLLRSARSGMYQGARLLGDVNAAARGRLPQRLVRKALGRIAGSFINRLVR